jgi:hypothetical protein
MSRKTKLVLAWVDLTGIEATGRYRDRLMQHAEFRSVPEAKAACWSDDTPAMRARLEAHVAAEAKDHVWMGFFALPNTANILGEAKALALLAECAARRTP